MTNLTNEVASRLLGKKIDLQDEYNPEILVAVPRFENRQQYGINNNSLPFKGWDIWHCYEFSCLRNNGTPITRVLKICYNCESEYIIESKSLKLYLNSYNMAKCGANEEECLLKCKTLIEKDLSLKLKTKVIANFIGTNCAKIPIFEGFINISSITNENDIKISHYKEAPEVLVSENINEEKEYYLTYDSLRSNCRVTHQPDFGDVFIYYKSKKHIKEESLVEYLCSFRSEYHFHEECCEMIYKRIADILNPNDTIFVGALYTRRGGIDICPVRWNNNYNAKDINNLIDTKIFARYGIKQ